MIEVTIHQGVEKPPSTQRYKTPDSSGALGMKARDALAVTVAASGPVSIVLGAENQPVGLVEGARP